MRWPADVLAYYVLAAGFRADEAPMVVALALAATEGDDTYRFDEDAPGARSSLGAWAIPSHEAALFSDLDPLRLSQAAKLLRALRTAHDGSWDWLPVYVVGDWRNRLDDATAGVKDPRAGLDSSTGLIRTSMDETSNVLSSALVQARASMLAGIEHLHRQG